MLTSLPTLHSITLSHSQYSPTERVETQCLALDQPGLASAVAHSVVGMAIRQRPLRSPGARLEQEELAESLGGRKRT